MALFKNIIKMFNGTDWDTYYPRTTADQVLYKKSDDTETNLQAEVANKQNAIPSTAAVTTMLGKTPLTANRVMTTNENGQASVSSVSAEALGLISNLTSDAQQQIDDTNKKINTLSGLIKGIAVTVYDGSQTTIATLLKTLTGPIICLLSTEKITDKPTPSTAGSIVIVKYSNTRASAILLCTDAKMYVNSWNSTAATGWKEK